MAETEFLKPSLAEYQALVKLRKAGFSKIFVKIAGSGDSGVYEPIDYIPSDKDSKSFRSELQILEEYLRRNLNARGDFSFDGDGCVGEISISLKKDEFTMSFETEVPVWMGDVYVEESISPVTEIEKLAAEAKEEM